MVEYREIMNESLSFVQNLFQEDKRSDIKKIYTKKYQPKNIEHEEYGIHDIVFPFFNSIFTGFPSSIQSPDHFCSYSPFPFSQPLAILLNVIFNRFFEILSKQIHFASILNHRSQVCISSLFCESYFSHSSLTPCLPFPPGPLYSSPPLLLSFPSLLVLSTSLLPYSFPSLPPFSLSIYLLPFLALFHQPSSSSRQVFQLQAFLGGKRRGSSLL